MNTHKDENMVKMSFMVYLTPKNKSKQPNPKQSERRVRVKMLYIQLYSVQMNFIYKVTFKIKIVCALQKPREPPNKEKRGNVQIKVDLYTYIYR